MLYPPRTKISEAKLPMRSERKWIFFTLSLLLFLYSISIFVNPRKLISSLGERAEFVDLYFEPILNSFKYKTNNTEKHQEKEKTFLIIQDQFEFNSSFWNYQLVDIYEDRCPKKCLVTGNVSDYKSVDAIVFYLCNVKGKKHIESLFPKRILTQPWIILSFEGPFRATKTKFRFSELNGIFNRTMNYKSNSDVIVPHGFVIKKDDAEYLPKQWTMPAPDYEAMEKSKMAVAFISNCQVESGRMDYIRELQKYVSVDIYGKCGEMKCGERKLVKKGYNATSDKCFQMVSKQYMFYLSFENAICKDYVSEKLYNILYYPIIPIVMGGADYQNLLPPKSYLNALSYTPKDLATVMTNIKNNITLQRDFFQWRHKYQPSTMGGDRTMCHLCIRLHDPTFYQHSVIEDFPNWFVKDSHCKKSWSETFMPINN